MGTVRFSSITPKVQRRTRPKVLIGSSEDPKILENLERCSDVIKAGGAGHKLLMVALGQLSGYKPLITMMYSMHNYYWTFRSG